MAGQLIFAHLRLTPVVLLVLAQETSIVKVVQVCITSNNIVTHTTTKGEITCHLTRVSLHIKCKCLSFPFFFLSRVLNMVACGNGGAVYTCTTGTYVTGSKCLGTSTVDTQTCAGMVEFHELESFDYFFQTDVTSVRLRWIYLHVSRGLF